MCGMGYEPAYIGVLQQQGSVTVVHAECPRCQSAAILAVLAGMLGIVTTMGMLTDMTREDVERFKDAKVISSDDVLRLHAVFEHIA